jgi:CubicO group peptidase (beta-lactamase class C family)
MRIKTIAAALLLATPVLAQQPLPTSAGTDPATLGWMQGSPVPPDKQIRSDNGSSQTFPQTRWSYSNMRRLLPTIGINRQGPVSGLPRAVRADLDSVAFTTLDGKPLTWGQSFDANFTDGIVVLHRGRVVYERYAGALTPEGRHIAFSVTKSFVGTLAELLIHQGKLDPARTVASYVPELAGSGFGGATLRQLLDMRTAIDFSEDYEDYVASKKITDIARMAIAGNMVPAPAGFSGPDGTFAFAASIPGAGAHGGDFVYRTPNTTALQWVVERVGGAPIATQIEQVFWRPMGMEQEAYILTDQVGTAFGGGGLSASLRDMARVGEMIRKGGVWNGKTILPAEVAKAVLAPGDAAAFANWKSPGLEGGSYRSQWWHRAGGQTLAVGIHGQAIYIDPKAEMVIARFASHPVAGNRAINPTTIPAYDAIAAHLNRTR